MKFDLRYNLQNIGSIFVVAVQKTADTTLAYSKGAFLTYDITLIRRKEQKLAREIGARVTLLIGEGKMDICHDKTLSELVGSLNSVVKELASLEQQRNSLLTPAKKTESTCECSITHSEQRVTI